MKIPIQVNKKLIPGAVLLLIVIALIGFAIPFIANAPTIAYAQEEDTQPEITLIQVAEGLARPVSITHANDGSGQLFIVEQRGRIYLLDGELLAEPFLNIEVRVQSPDSGGENEEGLLGLAFPPGYTSKGYFYVYYTMQDGNNVVSRFSLTSDRNIADPDSEEQILTLPHPTYQNHNGGQLAFGPDGYLYIGTGDGGGGGDPGGNAQNPASLNGKILRIDVENTLEGTRADAKYAIPADNPFVGDSAYQPEIWALGLRNPWRFSFDRLTGDLFIADVGQNSREEVNFQPADSPGGENYGWNIYEGELCYSGSSCDPAGMTMPIHTYPTTSPECSITGGYLYRSNAYPDLQGLYIFGDFCSGKLWGLQQDGDSWVHQSLADTNFRISTFGEDQVGNIYLADMVGGAVYQITTNQGPIYNCYFPSFRK